MKYYSKGGDLIYGSPRAAGIDLQCIGLDKDAGILYTGAHFEIPLGLFGMLVPRSGLGMKQSLALRNTIGIIDADYRGEVMIAYDQDKLKCAPEDLIGDRVAQLIILPYHPVALDRVTDLAELESTDRGDGAFGSTGR